MSEPPAVAGGPCDCGMQNADWKRNGEWSLIPQSEIRIPQSAGPPATVGGSDKRNEKGLQLFQLQAL